MRPELKAIVKSFDLKETAIHPVFSHSGTAGAWEVVSLVTGMGPHLAREATQKALAAGPFDHVMVVGIAGGLDPALPVGSLMVPSRVQLYPDGPVYQSQTFLRVASDSASSIEANGSSISMT